MNKAKVNYRSIFLFMALLLTATSFVSAEGYDADRKKEYKQSFDVGSSDRLLVENRYGNVTITHWDKKEVSIVVVVEAKARNDRRVQEILERVSIDMDKSGNTVRAITSFKNNGKNSGRNNERFSINYYISMPSTLELDLSLRYGNIKLPDKNEGNVRIELKYGALTAGNFRKDLSIEAGYSNIDIGDFKKLRAEASYCGKFHIKSGDEASIEGKYSNFEMRNVNTLRLESKYGNLKAERVEKATVEFAYNNGDIEYLGKELQVYALSYGTLEIKELSPNFTKVNAEARYGNLNIRIPSKAAFTVNAEDMKYGNLNVKGFNAQIQKEGSTHRAVVNNGGNRTIHFEGGNYSNLKITAL